jgi:hypothetical protein
MKRNEKGLKISAVQLEKKIKEYNLLNLRISHAQLAQFRLRNSGLCFLHCLIMSVCLRFI